MKISEFNKIERKINNSNFNENYKFLNRVMLFLSYFGHIASIFLAYFLLYKIISYAIENVYVASISSLIILFGLEYLKRDLFNKFSLGFIKAGGKLIKSLNLLLFVSVLMVCISFVVTLNGAKEFSSRAEVIQSDLNTNIRDLRGELNKERDSIISIRNVDIMEKNNLIRSKDSEQTAIYNQDTNPTRLQLSRVNDLKAEKEILRGEIVLLQEEIKSINDIYDSKIKESETEMVKQSMSDISLNDRNIIMFVIISIFIESIIVIGVYFNQYYLNRSYLDFKRRLDTDKTLKTWVFYNKLLGIIYSDNHTTDTKIATNKNIIDICKINNIHLSANDLSGFFKMLSSLELTLTKGSSRYFLKSKEETINALMEYFNVK